MELYRYEKEESEFFKIYSKPSQDAIPRSHDALDTGVLTNIQCLTLQKGVCF